MLTNRCLERPFVINYELEYAMQRGIPLFIVLLDELDPKPWSKENADRLSKNAIMPESLVEILNTTKFPNTLLARFLQRKSLPPRRARTAPICPQAVRPGHRSEVVIR